MRKNARRVVILVLLLLSLGIVMAAAWHVVAVQSPGSDSAAPVRASDTGVGFFSTLFKVYMPRRSCMAYETPVIWLHLVSDLLIAAAYYSIPVALLVFVRRRRDIAFGWIFWLFAAFILACGTTHVIGVIDLWKPFYKIDGIVKFITAVVSVFTAAVLWPLIPRALSIPSRSDLEKEVTERTDQLRRSNDALQESDAKFKLMANSVPHLAWMAKADGWIFWYNQRWFDYTGTTADQMDGWGWQSVHDPDELPRVMARWQESIQTGTPFDMTFSLKGADGQFRPFLTRVMPSRDDRGQVRMWFGTNTDVSEQKQVEQTLREKEERLRLALMTPDMWSWDWNLLTAEMVMTEGAEKCWGRTRGLASEFSRSIPSEDVSRCDAIVEAAKANGTTYTIEHRLRTPGGDERWVVGRGRIFLDESGKAVRSVGVATDITEQRRAREEREQLLEAERTARADAERTARLKDEFLATLSHELRTPLNAILGWSQLLNRHAKEDETLQEGLAVIERNSRLQAQLIEDLLDMSAILSGKVRMDVQQVRIADVIEAAVESIRPTAETKSVRIEKVIDSRIGAVRGDPTRLQQILWNLFSNAIKFTPKGGKIQVALERVNSHVEITVTDTGAGIKPEFLPHVFERFRQADASTTRKFGGLGLGLAIVKHLVELHGGKVRAKSPGEGMGATFVVELPLMVVHKDERDVAREHPRRSDFNAAAELCDLDALLGVKVLVVDDEPDARQLVSRVLSDCKAEVTVAASAAEAHELMRQNRFDVILSDIGMPDEDGYDFIKRVRMLPDDQGGRTPSAALTAFARSEDRTRALRAGYQSHVAKPVEPSELITVVASLAGRTGPKRG